MNSRVFFMWERVQKDMHLAAKPTRETVCGHTADDSQTGSIRIPLKERHKVTPEICGAVGPTVLITTEER